MSIVRPDRPESEIHDILRNDRRRQVLKQLRERGGEIDLRSLAEKIAEIETGESPPPKNIRKSVYNSLHQTHLPKLDDKGIVDYDKNRKTIELGDGARQVGLYMEVTNSYGLTWSEYYRTVATVGLMTVLLALVEAPLVSLLEPLIWTVLFLGVVAVSTGYQLWANRWFYLRDLA